MSLNPYSVLLGGTALALLYAAWRERQRGNRDDASALGLCGAGLGTLAGVFAYLL